MTPKSNRKAKSPTNKQGREIEQESPSSPPPAPNKRVDMISWGQNSNSTYETKSQTDEDTPPPQVTKYNQNTRPPSMRFFIFKRKNKMNKIRELLEKPIQKKTECKPSIAIRLGGRDITDQH